MKHAWIVLLLLAAAAGVYFFLQKKKPEPVTVFPDKSLLTGTWNSLEKLPGDSQVITVRYEFTADGKMLVSRTDSLPPDTLLVAWTPDNHVQWKKNVADSSGPVFRITRLNRDSLQWQNADSVVQLLIRSR
jgi:hypothetical protein